MSDLAKWQRNALFKAVAAGGLEPRECTIHADDTGTVITHAPSRARCFVTDSDGHYKTHSVIPDTPSWPPLDRYTWTAVTEVVERWASDVKLDTETPDMWAELQRERELFSGAWTADVQNTLFTLDEQMAIAEQLRQVKDWVSKTYAMSTAQMDSLQQSLDYLAGATARAGRRDWVLMAVGIGAGWILQSLVPPEAAQEILGTLLDGVRDLIESNLRNGPPQLPGGS